MYEESKSSLRSSNGSEDWEMNPAIDDIYNSCMIAQSKSDFEEYGYEEYFRGLYTVNDLASAFVELYKKIEQQ